MTIYYHPMHDECADNLHVCKYCGSLPGQGCKYDESAMPEEMTSCDQVRRSDLREDWLSIWPELGTADTRQ